MQVNSISLYSLSGLNSSLKNKEQSTQLKTSSPIKSNVTMSLWGKNENGVIPFAPYFAGNKTKKSQQAPKQSFVQPVLPAGYERPGAFEVCNIDKLTCPSCGKPMLPRPEYEILKERLAAAKPQDYIGIVSEYEPYMLSVEANVFNMVKKVADKEPKKPLDRIIKDLRAEKLPELQNIQMEKLNRMWAATTSLPKNERGNVQATLAQAQQKIQNTKSKKHFKRKDFIEDVANMKIRDGNVKKQMLKIANGFPTSSEAECAWIAKYSGPDAKGKARSSKEIAERFLLHSFTNTDHMLAQDLGGKDIIPNYIAMHSGCNGEKTNKTFIQWFKEDPENRLQYMNKYFDEVQEALDSGDIDDSRYVDYATEAPETIYKITNGEVDVRKKPKEKDDKAS
ncbi:MAG: hypothetical protein PHV37_09640 [Candidatus Gastranaerophilales bacterium]|nr:hypothetical protein [Candidatus Gastranaerophilales bacterium]